MRSCKVTLPNIFNWETTWHEVGSCSNTSSHRFKAIWNCESRNSVQDSSVVVLTTCVQEVTPELWGFDRFEGSSLPKIPGSQCTSGGNGRLKTCGFMLNISSLQMIVFQQPCCHGRVTTGSDGSSLQALRNKRSDIHARAVLATNPKWKNMEQSLSTCVLKTEPHVGSEMKWFC